MVDYSPLLRRVLKDHGWEYLRPWQGRSSDLDKPQDRRTVSVDAKSKSRHLSNKILKELGIGKKF